MPPLDKKEKHELCKAIFEDRNVTALQLSKSYASAGETKNFKYGNLTRIINTFLDTSGTKEADEKNRDLLRFVSTKDGQLKFTRAIFAQIMNIDLSKIYSSDLDEVINFAKENYGLLATAWDPFFIDNLTADETYITLDILDVYMEMRTVFQSASGPLNLVRSFASPEILNDSYEEFETLEMTEKIVTRHPEALMKSLDESAEDPIQYFIPFGKFNEDKKVELAGLKKLKEMNVELKKFSDFAKYKFFNENGERLKLNEVLKTASEGKQITIEEKTAEEMIPVQKASRTIPTWNELTEFLRNNYGMNANALSDKTQALKFIVVDPEAGKSKPLVINAEMQGLAEPENKDSFDKLTWALDNSKPLGEFTKEEQDKFISLIAENKIAIYSPYLDGKKSVMLKAEHGRIVTGDNVDAKKLLGPAYNFFENHLAQKGKQALTDIGLVKMQNEFLDSQIERKADALVRKYGLSNAVRYLFTNSGIDPDTIEDFDFMKNGSFEEKKEALNRYFTELYKKPEEYLSEEERTAMEEEGLEIADVRALAYNHHISVKEYINQKILANSANEQIDAVLEEINNELRAKAADPIEKEMAETMIRMKELSFTAGNRVESDRLLAKFVVLKAIEEKYSIKESGAESENARDENIRKALASADKYAEEVYNSEPFRYSLKKITDREMSVMTRGNTFDVLDQYYVELRNFVKNKKMEDPMVQLDKICTYSDYAISNFMYVPDKIDLNGNLSKDLKNPFNLSVSRKAFSTYVIGKMLEKGFEIEDVLDPYKLLTVKRDIGQEAFEQFQIGTEDNMEKVAHSYMAVMEKCVACANKQLNKLDSLIPAEIVKLNDPTFFAIGSLLKDSMQELGNLKNKKAFTGEFGEKVEKISNEADALNKYYAYTEMACKDILHYNRGEKAASGNSTVTLLHCVNMEYLNKLFCQIKKSAVQKGNTISKELCDQVVAAPDDLNTAVARAQNVQGMIVKYISTDISQQALSAIDSGADNKKKLAKDVFTGAFGKNIQLKITEIKDPVEDLSFSADPEKYFDQFKKVPVQKVK